MDGVSLGLRDAGGRDRMTSHHGGRTRTPERRPELLDDLGALIRASFPLGDFMGVRPRRWSAEGLELWAPAGPSVNLHGTMFGGSIAALGILTGWGWLRLELQARGRSVPVVVQDSRTTFERPIHGPCVARCLPPDPSRLGRFLTALERKGRGRIGLRVEIRGAASAADVDTGGPESWPAGPAAVIEARFAGVPDPTAVIGAGSPGVPGPTP